LAGARGGRGVAAWRWGSAYAARCRVPTVVSRNLVLILPPTTKISIPTLEESILLYTLYTGKDTCTDYIMSLSISILYIYIILYL